ncbi:hypothetical protein [Streptomyces caelestis]|uniref:hypothetical protein n=1 Tax=Streptomyces caelestis TaxID=36816 RepID=UPI003702EF1D
MVETGARIGDRRMDALPLNRQDPFDQPSRDLARLRHHALTGLTNAEWDILTASLTTLHDELREEALDQRRGHRPRLRGGHGTGCRPKLMMYRGMLEALRWSRSGWNGYRAPLDGAFSLADRGFPSYGQYAAATATGAQLLRRVSSSFALPVNKRLSEGVYLPEPHGERRRDRVTVRAIECSVSGDDNVSEVFRPGEVLFMNAVENSVRTALSQ